MWLIRSRGVYRPQEDTWLLSRTMAEASFPAGATVLDVCTGTGALAIAAARAGAQAVTAVDLSSQAIATAWVNSRIRGIPLELIHSDFAQLAGKRTFDVVLSNPPYVPYRNEELPEGLQRAWDAGPQGRAVLDRLCPLLPVLLNRGGTALIVHSALCGTETTLNQLRGTGLKASVVARETVPFGPVMRARAEWLESAGLIDAGQRHEELVVIRADRIEQ
ncbi:release factor glutamine methyltransferase [Kibdelosporangium banguiense]|uniref:Release factor glutamine methyltransferase n=1 Tax=Kibdelosporangium banguiense TaxID=1365924 RepID=A0ABS4TW62_9PSEU|nr:HemK2/MTQ2 family protein methyltransferase [Kibdelosporangium banguiense]MBP2328632.1 release factor glutamine methyltransferase [Kibdelosporangium banguiense]